MKIKKHLIIFLVAIMLISLSACTNENTDVDVPKDLEDSPDVNVDDEQTVTPEESPKIDESSESTKVYDYEDKGELFFDYPSSYSFSDDTGMLTFTNPEENLRIMVKATVNNTNDLENTIEYYESYNTYEEFKQEDVTIAGYEALQISYLDDWGDYKKSILVKLADDSALFNGISFEASSSEGEELLSDSQLNSMIESIRVTE